MVMTDSNPTVIDDVLAMLIGVTTEASDFNAELMIALGEDE